MLGMPCIARWKRLAGELAVGAERSLACMDGHERNSHSPSPPPLEHAQFRYSRAGNSPYATRGVELAHRRNTRKNFMFTAIYFLPLLQVSLFRPALPEVKPGF